MLARLLAAAAACVACAAAHADINCPGLFNQLNQPGTYFVLAYLGDAGDGASSVPRAGKRAQLESRVSPKMQDYVNRLAQNLGSAPPEVVLVTCDFTVAAQDFSRADAETLSNHNVIAVLWRGVENNRASVVHLSVPQYRWRTGATRRQVEVAWLHSSTTADTIDDWIRELDRENIAQQGLLAMGIGLVALKDSRWPLAKSSLCQVRSNLKLMAQEAVRPTGLEQEMLALVNEAISQADAKALQSGTNLNAIRQLKVACAQ